jgi:Ca2+/H+ antiporter
MIEITPASTIVLLLALIAVVVAANGLAELIGDRAYGWLLAVTLVGVLVAGIVWG